MSVPRRLPHTGQKNQERKGFEDGLHVFTLFGFAVTQPLFDVLSRHTEFFVVRRSEPLDVVLLVLFLCVLSPAVVVSLEVMAGLFGQPIRKRAHVLVVGGLAAVTFLPVLGRIAGLPDPLALVTVAAVGVAAAVGYLRFPRVRTFLTVLSPTLLLFPGFFLFNSQVFKVVFAEGGTEASYPAVDATAPVVVVVFDELEAVSLMDEHRRIDPIRYPNFAAMARDATWFRNATTVADNTVFSIPAILTGNYPDNALLSTAADHPRNLFTLLGGSYDVKAFGTMTQLCPEQLCGRSQETLTRRMTSLVSDLSVVYLHIVLPEDLRAELPPISRTWMDFRTNEVAARSKPKKKRLHKIIHQSLAAQLKRDRFRAFMEFVNAIESVEQPTLYFLHILLPHSPYQYLPSGKGYLGTPPRGLVEGKWGLDESAVIEGFQRYLLQVGFVDTLLGKLVARLKAIGAYDSSLIVVTADHGTSFRPGDSRRSLTVTNYQDIMAVPVFIKAPGQREGVISDRNVELIDILPTIADTLGLELSWSVDGQSAVDLSLPERRQKTIFYKQAKERLVHERRALEKSDVSLGRKLALFGSRDNEGLFKIGPHAGLVGRRVSQIDVTGNADVVVSLDHTEFYERLDPQTQVVPAEITGSGHGGPAAGDRHDLAIAVNGTIRAVTRTRPAGNGLWQWGALVPEESFRSGKNEVEVFVVSGTDQALRLQRTRGKVAVTYSLVTSGVREVIRSSEGASVPVIQDALQGHLDRVEILSDRVRFLGWAGDVENSELPRAILIFRDGSFLYSGRTNTARTDVAKALDNPALDASGFVYEFPIALFEDNRSSDVRLFAVSRHGLASELTYSEGYPW